MKSISTNLAAAINDGDIITLFAIIPLTGNGAYFTDHDVPYVFGGNTYIPAPGLQKFSLKLNNAAQVSNQNVIASVVDLPASELLAGVWDSASIQISICGWKETTPEAMTVFKGTIGVIGWTDSGFQCDIQNFVRNLGKNIGKMVMPTCRHRLYDLGTAFDEIGQCTVNPASFTVSSSVTYVLTSNLKVKIPLTGKSSGEYTSGYIQWLTGTNAGTTSVVKTHVLDSNINIGESLELLLPTSTPIQVGDTFNLLSGCDHTAPTCFSKFNNILNFGGFPSLQVDQNEQINLP